MYREGEILEKLELIGVLPYHVPGLERDYLTLKVGLQRLSIFVGPNAAARLVC